MGKRVKLVDKVHLKNAYFKKLKCVKNNKLDIHDKVKNQ